MFGLKKCSIDWGVPRLLSASFRTKMECVCVGGRSGGSKCYFESIIKDHMHLDPQWRRSIKKLGNETHSMSTASFVPWGIILTLVGSSMGWPIFLKVAKSVKVTLAPLSTPKTTGLLILIFTVGNFVVVDKLANAILCSLSDDWLFLLLLWQFGFYSSPM